MLKERKKSKTYRYQRNISKTNTRDMRLYYINILYKLSMRGVVRWTNSPQAYGGLYTVTQRRALLCTHALQISLVSCFMDDRRLQIADEFASPAGLLASRCVGHKHRVCSDSMFDETRTRNVMDERGSNCWSEIIMV